MSTPRKSAAALCVAAVFLVSCAAGPDREAGRRVAIGCQACHGLDGLSRLPGAPDLTGRTAAYLVQALQAYRSGARKNAVMSIAARDLTDDDINDVAAYYAAIPNEAKPAAQ